RQGPGTEARGAGRRRAAAAARRTAAATGTDRGEPAGRIRPAGWRGGDAAQRRTRSCAARTRASQAPAPGSVRQPMKPILDGLKKLVVLGYTAGQGGGMVRNGPRDRTARSRSRGADRAFRAALVAALLSLLFLPGPIDAQQDAEDAAPADVAP